MTEQKNPNSPKNSLNPWLKYSGMGIQMAGIIAAGAWGGVELDKKYQFKYPVFTIVLLLIAVFAAIYIVVRDFIK